MKFALLVPVCALVASILPFCGGGIDRGSIEDLDANEVTYQTGDGVNIVASWFRPASEARPRVVILLHEKDGTREQWNELIPVLVNNGYAVLAPDLRGFGESTTVIRDGQEQRYTFGDSREALLDVDAALSWIQAQPDVDPGYIAMVGARLGADLTYVSTGLFPHLIKAGIAMTPSQWTDSNQDGIPEDPLFATIKDYAAHDIFFQAGGEAEWIAAASVGVRVQNPGGRRYIDHPDLDGVELTTIDQPIEDILDWLKARYESPVPTSAI
jgi:dienelactone hydrolase